MKTYLQNLLPNWEKSFKLAQIQKCLSRKRVITELLKVALTLFQKFWTGP